MNVTDTKQLPTVIFSGKEESFSILLKDKKLPVIKRHESLTLHECIQEQFGSVIRNYYCIEINEDNINNYLICYEKDKLNLSSKNSLQLYSLVDLKNLSNKDGSVLCHSLGEFWPILKSDEFLSKIKLPFMFSPKKINLDNKITFFGGSFNPWHQGHMTCLDLCPEDNIAIIPDKNPWKKIDNTNCAWNSLKSLCEKVKDLPYAVYPRFIGLNTPNPTINWLPGVNIEIKQLLVGEDTFFSLTKWLRAQELFKIIDKIYVVPRDLEEFNLKREDIEISLKKLSTRLKIEILPEHPYQNLSSTELRNHN